MLPVHCSHSRWFREFYANHPLCIRYCAWKYASPEQLARPNLGYDQKADIYSLGIIFFELYHPFTTLMERHAVLRTLRGGELPLDFVSRWPKEAAFVLWLMAEDPRMRPTAREILEFDLIRKPKDEQVGSSIHVSTDSRPRSSRAESSGLSLPSLGVASSSSERDISEVLCGLGSDIQPLSDPNLLAGLELLGRIICETCQVQCRCPAEADDLELATKASGDLSQPRRNSISKDHHPPRSMSSKASRSELERRLKEESDKVKRLEMSMADIRAENKALLDRIEALEKERETA